MFWEHGKCIDNCISCEKTGNNACDKCKTGYVLAVWTVNTTNPDGTSTITYDYFCEKCLTGCDECEWSSGKCKKCHDG